MAEKAKLEVTLLRLGTIPGLLIYVGVGALCHALFAGSHFDWSSAWTWGWLFGWPIVLLFGGMAVAVVIFAAVVLWLCCDGLATQWRSHRRLKRSRAQFNNRRFFDDGPTNPPPVRRT